MRTLIIIIITSLGATAQPIKITVNIDNPFSGLDRLGYVIAIENHSDKPIHVVGSFDNYYAEYRFQSGSIIKSTYRPIQDTSNLFHVNVVEPGGNHRFGVISIDGVLGGQSGCDGYRTGSVLGRVVVDYYSDGGWEKADANFPIDIREPTNEEIEACRKMSEIMDNAKDPVSFVNDFTAHIKQHPVLINRTFMYFCSADIKYAKAIKNYPDTKYLSLVQFKGSPQLQTKLTFGLDQRMGSRHPLLRTNIVILVLGLISCSESEIVEPDPPGRRDYIWNVDTIQYQDARQTLMSEIAARGTDNVFIAGYCSGGQYGYFWHYDGETWMPYPFHDEARLPSVGVPRRIYDNRDGSFWAVGSLISPARRGARDLVVSYEKGKWTWHNLQLPKEITSVYSTSINDAWIGGEKGYVAHFSHNKWEQDSIPITSAYGHKDVYGGIDIAVDREGETVFMTYLSHDAGGTTYYLYRGGINNWSIIDSSTNNREWGGRMWVGPDKYIYSRL